jgi:hypothetical protein
MSCKEVDRYLDAAVASSARVRGVAVVLVTVSVIIFGTIWNARPNNWTDARLSLVRAALEHWGWSQTIHTLDPHERDEFLRSERAFGHGRFTKEEAQKLSDELSRLDLSQSTFTAVFGVPLDVNDRGFLAGLALSVILLWLRWTLWRESENTRFLFENAGERLPECYNVLAMYQVILVPPVAGRASGRIGLAPFFLLGIPPALQALVLAEDLATVGAGYRLSQFNTLVMVGSGSLFLVVLAGLAVRCFVTIRRTMGYWKDKSREVNLLPPRPRADLA